MIVQPIPPSSSIPEFGYPYACKPFGYLFEYAELALNVHKILGKSLEQLNVPEKVYENLHF
jgi:hypothetical protein